MPPLLRLPRPAAVVEAAAVLALKDEARPQDEETAVAGLLRKAADKLQAAQVVAADPLQPPSLRRNWPTAFISSPAVIEA